MMSGTPKATERSEGGSDNPRTRRPKASGLYPVYFPMRLDEQLEKDLKRFSEGREWSMNQAARALIRRGLASYDDHLTLDYEPHELQRERFEDGA
jgi:hypothetical protein